MAIRIGSERATNMQFKESQTKSTSTILLDTVKAFILEFLLKHIVSTQVDQLINFLKVQRASNVSNY